MTFEQELKNLKFRPIEVPINEIFPKYDEAQARALLPQTTNANQHIALLEVMKELGKDDNAGYRRFLDQFGFHDKKYAKFSGHCHQSVPVLGLALRLLDFDADYLECARVEQDPMIDGVIVYMNPLKEPNDANREEFCEIGRIPYCCLDAKINNTSFLVSPKHVRVEKKEQGEKEEYKVTALLTPECYLPNIGPMKHQEEAVKSAMYLQPYVPRSAKRFQPDKQPVWIKQKVPKKGEAPEPLELFATYLRIKLV